jgi:hypothetical protein
MSSSSDPASQAKENAAANDANDRRARPAASQSDQENQAGAWD